MSQKISHSGVVESILDGCVKVRIIQTSACAACKVASHCNAAESKVKIVDIIELCRADLVKNGIYLSGGGALLRGLDKRLTDKIGIQFHVAEDPLHAVAKGTGVALKNYKIFQFLKR